MARPLYIFLDEAGNFDFSPKGTKLLTLTAVSGFRPFEWEQPLVDLRYKIWESRHEVEVKHFHAQQNPNPIRNQVYDLLSRYAPTMRVDSLIVDKRKTYKPLQDFIRFYPKMLGYLLRYIFEGYSLEEVSDIHVLLDSIQHEHKKSAIQKAVKVELASIIAPHHKYSVDFHDSKAVMGLQMADYFCWAIHRKWEMNDPKFFDVIKPAVRSQFDIFQHNNKFQY